MPSAFLDWREATIRLSGQFEIGLSLPDHDAGSSKDSIAIGLDTHFRRLLLLAVELATYPSTPAAWDVCREPARRRGRHVTRLFTAAAGREPAGQQPRRRARPTRTANVDDASAAVNVRYQLVATR